MKANAVAAFLATLIMVVRKFYDFNPSQNPYFATDLEENVWGGRMYCCNSRGLNHFKIDPRNSE